jgi:hypothetical protein
LPCKGHYAAERGTEARGRWDFKRFGEGKHSSSTFVKAPTFPSIVCVVRSCVLIIGNFYDFFGLTYLRVFLLRIILFIQVATLKEATCPQQSVEPHRHLRARGDALNQYFDIGELALLVPKFHHT